MSESKSDVVKPARPPARTRARKADVPPEDQPVAAPAVEDEGFAAGIVDGPAPESKPAPAPEVRETKRAERAERTEAPRAETPPPAARVDPNEHGFDAETNSRYEQIKKGNTYITELQHMTMQLRKPQKKRASREEYKG